MVMTLTSSPIEVIQSRAGLLFCATFLVDFARVDLRLARLDFFGFQLQSPECGSEAVSRHWLLVFFVFIYNILESCSNP